jgi:ATP-dependent Clp protease ATP-binding subunit ClpA
LALRMKQEQQTMKEKLDAMKHAQDGDRRSPIQITEDDIAQVIGRMTGIPVTKLLKSEAKRLTNLELVLRKSIIGQDEAIKKVARAIRRSNTIEQLPSPASSWAKYLSETFACCAKALRVMPR